MTASLIRWARSAISSFFSSRIEDSFRLRTLTLAGLWVAAMGLAWVGGDLRFCLAGGAVGTVGHLFSYKMRYRPTRLRSIVIAVLVVALSVYLRNDMIKIFSGDWVPLGQYLVLVSGLAAFDLRTRGGLYTGWILSGMVLFFASQQAFEYSFGVFVAGFLVVMLAFLVLSFLEDMIMTARVYWAKKPAESMVYWTVTICAMFLLAGLAFWVLPRGGNTLAGQPQLAVLPYSGADIDIQQSPVQLEGEAGLSAEGSTSQPGQTRGLQGEGAEPGATPLAGAAAERFGDRPQTGQPVTAAPVYRAGGVTPAAEAPNPLAGPGEAANAGNGGDPSTVAPETMAGPGAPADAGQSRPAARDNRSENGEDPVVFHVRSKVASYWRGLVLEDYDGSRWFVSDLNNKMIQSPSDKGTWYNRENDFSGANVNYSQTFFLRGNDLLPMVTGYRAVQVVVNDDQTDDALLASGASYQVISSLPRHTPDQLRGDRSAGLSPELTILPQNTEQALMDLAEKIVTGASSDFEKLGRIMSFLNTNTDPVQTGSTGLASIATLDEFLFQGMAGSILDYATATVMLARASGMPARLAVGYLPGVRDPLSGTYRVRESDRHAWAEVRFDKNGWVPFDGAPRGGFAFGQRPPARLDRLFLSRAGDQAYAALTNAPQEAFQALSASVPGPVLLALFPAITLVILTGRWLQSMPGRRPGGPGRGLPPYAVIPGDRRREIKKIHAQVERLIRRNGGTPRAPWQTAGHYASSASGRGPEIDGQLSWFTQTVWRAAYRGGDLPAGVVAEASRRLALLKEAFKASRLRKTSIQEQ